MKKTTVLVAAVLAVAAVLTVGLAVFPTSIQETQANPCANEISRGGSADNAFIPQDDDERECDFTGYFDFEEEVDSEDIPSPTGAFTISGQAIGLVECPGRGPFPATIITSAQGEEDGTVTGTVNLVTTGGGGIFILFITDGTTDGNTFSLSGEDSFCSPGETTTVSGDCGTDVTVRWEEPLESSTFTGDVECTLA